MGEIIMTTKAELQAALASRWMDDGLAAIANHPKASADLLLFIFAFQHYCVHPKAPGGENSRKLRSSAWQIVDVNGNEIVSLAEVGKFIKEHLSYFYTNSENKSLGVDVSEAERLYKLFYPCFIRAFLDAADYGSKKKVTRADTAGKSYLCATIEGDDYVQFGEFRLFLTYLCIYATIWEAFGIIDGGKTDIDDRRISKAEWDANRRNLVGHPLDSLSVSAVINPDKVFAAMDSDGKGMVLLKEFSEYIEDFEYALGSRWGTLLNAHEDVKDAPVTE